MKKNLLRAGAAWRLFLAFGLVAALGTGCSSSALKEVEGTEEPAAGDELAAEDSSADEIPAPEGEALDAPPVPEETVAEAVPTEAAPAEAATEVAEAVEAPAEEPGSVAAAAPEEEQAAPEIPAPVAAAQPAAPAASGGTEEVPVRAGETLMKIAFDRYGDPFAWRKILEANRDRIADPSRIPAGTVLRLESTGYRAVASAGDPYMIRGGDTLGTISGKVYGLTAKWKRLWDNNRTLIRDPNLIFVGFTLYYTFTEEDRAEYAKATGVQPSPGRIPASSGL